MRSTAVFFELQQGRLAEVGFRHLTMLLSTQLKTTPEARLPSPAHTVDSPIHDEVPAR